MPLLGLFIGIVLLLLLAAAVAIDVLVEWAKERKRT